jgi:hypothetical protein
MKNKQQSKEEMGAYGTMIAVTIVCIVLVLAFIFKL